MWSETFLRPPDRIVKVFCRIVKVFCRIVKVFSRIVKVFCTVIMRVITTKVYYEGNHIGKTEQSRT